MWRKERGSTRTAFQAPRSRLAPAVTDPTPKVTDAFPRLAGQLNDYIFKKLVNWSKERGQDKAKPDSSEIMAPIAHNLTEAQVKAVAAYVSQLN